LAYERLLVETSEAIATVTVNRPDKLNALDRRTVAEIGEAAAAIGARRDVRVVIVTGAGDKAFVAGADIAEMADLDADGARAFARAGQTAFGALEAMPQPVLAAVGGFALGGGCELALACDLVYASDRARFGQPEVTLGVIPGFGGTQRLARRVGVGKARELCYTGAPLDAAEALRIGLADAVFPSADLAAKVREIARAIAAKGPLAVAAAKRVIATSFDAEADAFGGLFATRDQKEGMRAFLEKRKPDFRGE
jgi:enoyl-CoA hydratase